MSYTEGDVIEGIYNSLFNGSGLWGVLDKLIIWYNHELGVTIDPTYCKEFKDKIKFLEKLK